MATVTFYGAAQQVTGSCYLIETEHSRVLLECGIKQGEDRKDIESGADFDFDPASVDALIISHTHLDHSGMTPLLVKQGFSGPIYATTATKDLLPIMFYDAASLLRSDIERKNRRLQRAGKDLLELPYSARDVEQAISQVTGIDYRVEKTLLPGIRLCFQDAGHILGSAIVELWIDEHGSQRKLVFSGDLGNHCAPLLQDPHVATEADTLLLESTYGDRNHRPLAETLDELRQVLEDASTNGGNILIPAFAVGRTQDLIYWLGQLHREGVITRQKVFIDSPMAIKVSTVYERHQQLFNEDDPDFRRFVEEGWDKWLPGLTYTESPEDSMMLNRITEGAIIIAGSGMCTGGRILHHFKHNLWREKSHVVIVGYQAVGTLGRALVDGVKQVKIFGDEIAVKARIHTLGGFSAHAGQDQLLTWAGQFKAPQPQLLLVHGEIEAMQSLQQRLAKDLDWNARIPSLNETIEI